MRIAERSNGFRILHAQVHMKQLSQVKNQYLELVSLIERLHRRFLDLVQIELTARKIDDLSGVQAMILFNIGDAELTVGEMTARGCYHGSNVSYNVKKM